MVISAEFYNSMPEWKTKKCLGLMSHFPVDLEEIEKWSGFRFATPELVEICSSAIATFAGGVVEVTNPTRTGSTATTADRVLTNKGRIKRASIKQRRLWKAPHQRVESEAEKEFVRPSDVTHGAPAGSQKGYLHHREPLPRICGR